MNNLIKINNNNNLKKKGELIMKKEINKKEYLTMLKELKASKKQLLNNIALFNKYSINKTKNEVVFHFSDKTNVKIDYPITKNDFGVKVFVKKYGTVIKEKLVEYETIIKNYIEINETEINKIIDKLDSKNTSSKYENKIDELKCMPDAEILYKELFELVNYVEVLKKLKLKEIVTVYYDKVNTKFYIIFDDNSYRLFKLDSFDSFEKQISKMLCNEIINLNAYYITIKFYELNNLICQPSSFTDVLSKNIDKSLRKYKIQSKYNKNDVLSSEDVKKITKNIFNYKKNIIKKLPFISKVNTLDDNYIIYYKNSNVLALYKKENESVEELLKKAFIISIEDNLELLRANTEILIKKHTVVSNDELEEIMCKFQNISPIYNEKGEINKDCKHASKGIQYNTLNDDNLEIADNLLKSIFLANYVEYYNISHVYYNKDSKEFYIIFNDNTYIKKAYELKKFYAEELTDELLNKFINCLFEYHYKNYNNVLKKKESSDEKTDELISQ